MLIASKACNWSSPCAYNSNPTMEIFGETLGIATVLFLLLALLLAFSFEFVNGFHDTANAVATVIYRTP